MYDERWGLGSSRMTKYGWISGQSIRERNYFNKVPDASRDADCVQDTSLRIFTSFVSFKTKSKKCVPDMSSSTLNLHLHQHLHLPLHIHFFISFIEKKSSTNRKTNPRSHLPAYYLTLRQKMSKAYRSLGLSNLDTSISFNNLYSIQATKGKRKPGPVTLW